MTVCPAQCQQGHHCQHVSTKSRADDSPRAIHRRRMAVTQTTPGPNSDEEVDHDRNRVSPAFSEAEESGVFEEDLPDDRGLSDTETVAGLSEDEGVEEPASLPDPDPVVAEVRMNAALHSEVWTPWIWAPFMHVGPLSCDPHHSFYGDHTGAQCGSQCRKS